MSADQWEACGVALDELARLRSELASARRVVEAAIEEAATQRVVVTDADILMALPIRERLRDALSQHRAAYPVVGV